MGRVASGSAGDVNSLHKSNTQVIKSETSISDWSGPRSTTTTSSTVGQQCASGNCATVGRGSVFGGSKGRKGTSVGV